MKENREVEYLKLNEVHRTITNVSSMNDATMVIMTDNMNK